MGSKTRQTPSRTRNGTEAQACGRARVEMYSVLGDGQEYGFYKGLRILHMRQMPLLQHNKKSGKNAVDYCFGQGT